MNMIDYTYNNCRVIIVYETHILSLNGFLLAILFSHQNEDIYIHQSAERILLRSASAARSKLIFNHTQPMISAQ